MKSLVPDGLASWCKLMNSSVIDVQIEMDILRPMSRLFATATHQGDQFPPETRNALMNSRCLDTLVHYGNFEKQFALDAYHKIVNDPGYYERSDGSDRVYSGLDPRGNHEDGDARVAALRLLANNPAAAQEILEKDGPEGRRPIFEALRDKGLLGKEAAAVIEAGLQNLDSKASEDTLELLIKDTADGRLKLCDYGKQAMARIVSSQQALDRLKEVAYADSRSDEITSTTGDEGFNVATDTLQKFMGKVLDDKGANAEFRSGVAAYTAADFKAKVAAAGQTTIGDPESLSGLKTAIEDLGKFFQAVAKGVEDASGEKEKNAFLAAGLDLAVSQAVALVRGAVAGKFILDKALETGGKEGLDKILEAKNEERIKNLDKDGLKDELNRSVRNLVTVTLLRDKGVTDQLLDKDSPLRKNWDKNLDGQIEVPDPKSNEWKSFTHDVTVERKNGTLMGRALLEMEDWAETMKI